MNRNALFITAATAVAVLTLAGCAGAGESAESTASYSAQDCPDGTTNADILKVGALLPDTGSWSSIGPATTSGVGLAVNDIVAAGDTACTVWTDSGDSNDLSVSTASAQQLIDAQVSTVIGAASSTETLNVIDSITTGSNPIVQISPANTSPTLSGYSPFYFRTAPSDTVQGSVLANLMLEHGHANVAFLTSNDEAFIAQRDIIQSALEAANGAVTFGAAGAGQEFSTEQTDFAAIVAAALATNPDDVVVLAFGQTDPIVTELTKQGWSSTHTYFIDGGTSVNFSKHGPGTLKGAQGTVPGAHPTDEFKKRLSAWHEAVRGSAVTDYSYAAESYDAVILAALAALKAGAADPSNALTTSAPTGVAAPKAGATDPVSIQANLAAVSGANGGTECSSYAECKKLIEAGTEIHYRGMSGIGPFNELNDPSTAFIGVYLFDGNNKAVWQRAVEGTS